MKNLYGLVENKILRLFSYLKAYKMENKNSANKIKILNRNLRNIIIALFIISIILIPCGSLVVNSIFFSFHPLIVVTLDSYVRVLCQPLFQRCILNSLIISISTTLTAIIIGVFASYALSRIKSRWSRSYELFLYILQMFPGIAFIVPYFIIFILIKRHFFIQMQNTYHGLILTYISFALPFSILMLKNFISAIPREYDEQAQIDGCNRFDLVLRVIIPLSLPGILAIAVFSFIMSWNEILFAFSLTNKDTMTSSIYIINKLNTIYGVYNNWMDWNAACILVTLPIAILFAIFQKKMISGLSTNFLK